MIFDIFIFDHLISTNFSSRSVSKFPRLAPGHRARRRPIGVLRPSLHHLRIALRRFHQKNKSPWIRRHRKHHPIRSLWTSLNHCIISNACEEDVTWKGRHLNTAPPELLPNWQPKAIYLSSPIHVNRVSIDKGTDSEFTTTRVMKKGPADWEVAQAKGRSARIIRFLWSQTRPRAWKRLSII